MKEEKSLIMRQKEDEIV